MDLAKRIDASIRAIESLQCRELEAWGKELASALKERKTLLIAGNGGSAAQAQHFAAELVGTYNSDRGPLPAIALSTDPVGLTAIANDFGFDSVFSRQVNALALPGCILLCISTSGESSNVISAARTAVNEGIRTWALTGAAPNALSDTVDRFIAIESDFTGVVQEAHQVAIHLLCELIDEALAT